MASKRTLSPFLDKLMAYLAVEPGEWPGDPDALPYIKELVGLEHDYKIQWGTAGDAADALELQVRRRRDELIQIICRNYPDTANKLLLHDSVSSKADANDSATGTTTTHLERGQRWRMSEFQLIAATLDVRHCKPTLQPSSRDFCCPIELFRNAPFFFLVPISVFLEKISRQDALGATIPISLDLRHPLFR